MCHCGVVPFHMIIHIRFLMFLTMTLQVLVERIGTIDLVGLHASCGTEQFLSWVCFYHEIQERLMRNASEAQQKVGAAVGASAIEFRATAT